MDGLSKPQTGYCVMIDICDSTSLKDQAFDQWLAQLFKTLTSLQFTFNLLPQKGLSKIVGDMYMLWINHESCDTAARLLFKYNMHVTCNRRPPLKAAMVKADNCYLVSFNWDKQHPDIYGKGIDLTSRLLSLASPDEIIVNKAFHEDVRKSSERRDISHIPVEGPWTVGTLKGFENDPQSVFKYRLCP
jgi:class 3 adenylate cyclase